MSEQRRPVLFVDRDGTLIEEPPDQQVDAIGKIRFMPGVFAALATLRKAGYRLVIVTNQDGLGTPSFPLQAYEPASRFMLDAFASQGIEFEQVFVCPHTSAQGCECRKPKTALVRDFIAGGGIDLAASAVIGDRDTDLELAANLGIRGIRVRKDGGINETWAAAVRALTSRHAQVERNTNETRVYVAVNLDDTTPLSASTGIGFFDHMLEQLAKHGGFALELRCKGDLHIDEHHTVEDCAIALGTALQRALGNKIGIARYGFLLPMDEARVQVAIDLSGRAHSSFEGHFTRQEVGGFPTELVAHFFRSLADSMGAAIHVSVTGENTHHMIEACFKGVGRALRQAFGREGEDLPSTKGIL